MPTDSPYDFESTAVGVADRRRAGHSRDVAPPIHLSTTFELDEPGYPESAACYAPLGNPSRDALEDRLATLTGASDVLATASGMAAISTVALALLRPGDHVVASDSLYGGTTAVLDGFFSEFGVDVTFVDATDPETVADALAPETALVWMETPTNPLLKLCDIEAIADLTADHDAPLVVDNTFATPYGQRPLELGADVSVLSTTKFVNGHTDSVGGAIATADPDLGDRFSVVCEQLFGAALGAFDCYLVTRGLTTLPARMDVHERNATAVAEFLAGHDAVRTVNYPGLEDHPQHDLARRQLANFGGIVSVELDADEAETRAVLESLDVFRLAMSLGGVESLAEHPASMSAAALSPDEQAAAGITDSLVRLSVGLESAADLTTDLDRALSLLV